MADVLPFEKEKGKGKDETDLTGWPRPVSAQGYGDFRNLQINHAQIWRIFESLTGRGSKSTLIATPEEDGLWQPSDTVLGGEPSTLRGLVAQG
jgi:hypothetical protein